MLYVDGMNGVINHNETIQWLYTLIGSKVREGSGRTSYSVSASHTFLSVVPSETVLKKGILFSLVPALSQYKWGLLFYRLKNTLKL